MYRLYYCLTVEHDFRLVVVAAALCVISALATAATARRALDIESPVHQISWLIMAGSVAGIGIWGTHFVSMLAYESPLPIRYNIFGTVASLIVATVVTTCGWTYVARFRHPYSGAVGGAVIGAGVASMHFMGIAALDVGADIRWDYGMVAAAIFLGLQFCAVCGYAVAHLPMRRGIALAAVSFVFGVVSLHFLSMSAMELVPTVVGSVETYGPLTKLMAVIVALAVVLIVGLGLLIAGFDLHLGARRRAEGERMRSLAEATFEGLAVVRDGQMQDMNGRFCDMLQLGREDLIGTPINKLALSGPGGGQLETVEDRDPVTCKLRCRDGSAITVQVRARTVDYGGAPSRVYAFRDVSSEERARARITHLAHHDPLTGLPNRLKFRESLEDELNRAWEIDTQVAVMFFDLDHFKEVNDVHGHATGDALLVAVSERLLDALPGHAIAARLSGDEFAVVLPDAASREDATLIAQRVVNSVGSPLTLGKLHLKVSASGGITMFPLDGEDPDRLMNQADLALYRAKGQGRNQVCEFDPKLGQLLQERRMMEADLALAIEDELLELYYQPQVRLGDGAIVGFEALLRWHHDRRGFVAPSDFVQIAEETGLILKMGAWVLEQACREAVKWPDDRHVAVNVSPAQFKQGNLVYTVQRALSASGLDPRRLEIEITEGVLIDDEDRALDLLHKLKALGVGLSIDDFGTGYSSLAYLRAFPFDKIKIDRSFVAGIQNDPEAQIIVRATIDLARALKIRVVVEGVEEFAELSALQGQPDLVMQGFLLSRPITRGQLAGFDAESAGLRARIVDALAPAGPGQRRSA